jgi:hypothetical protein
MYKGNVSPYLCLEDIEKGFKLNNKTEEFYMSPGHDFLCINTIGIIETENETNKIIRKIYFYRNGDIASEYPYGIEKGIRLLKEASIVILNSEPEIEEI